MHNELTTLAPMIRRFAYSLTGSPHDADDLLQTTLERMLSRPIPADVDLAKWAFRVCRNIWIDDYRARRTRQAAAASQELTGDQFVDGEKIIYNQITLGEVNVAMEKLPDDQRAILALVAMQGMSYKEVAQTLEIPIGTVMSRLARARMALSEHMNKRAVELPI